MFKRMIIALESIAHSLVIICDEVKTMKEEQQRMLSAAREQAENAPQKVVELMKLIKSNVQIGGQNHGS